MSRSRTFERWVLTLLGDKHSGPYDVMSRHVMSACVCRTASQDALALSFNAANVHAARQSSRGFVVPPRGCNACVLFSGALQYLLVIVLGVPEHDTVLSTVRPIEGIHLQPSSQSSNAHISQLCTHGTAHDPKSFVPSTMYRKRYQTEPPLPQKKLPPQRSVPVVIMRCNVCVRPRL